MSYPILGQFLFESDKCLTQNAHEMTNSADPDQTDS